MSTWLSIARSALVILLATQAVAAAPPDVLTMDEALVLPRVGRYGRVPFPRDPLLAEITAGVLPVPRDGDTVTAIDGEPQQWQRATVDDKGWLTDPALRGGYAYWSVDSPTDRIMILQPSGHSVMYADGVPRAGDPYSNGWLQLPVQLTQGGNDFLFQVSRGRLRARLTEPQSDAFFSLREATLPDLIEGETWAAQGAVVIVNATYRRLENLVIRAGGSGLPVHETPVGAIEPLTSRKTPFWFGGALPPGTDRASVALTLLRSTGVVMQVLDEAEITVRVRGPEQRHRRTFVSEIDGSVQYYAVTPRATNGDDTESTPSLYLSLHGASVEAAGQAAVYEPKPDGDVVAPTNRRPFGFDWEDWGRLDALEVLKIARTRTAADPDRIFLTGHSMGGHGTWHLGVTFPGTFAAIGPSAGWRSFRSYTGAATLADDDPIERLLRRATSGSDTVSLSRNLLHFGVYILHGEADDNVPADQARFMHEHLSGFHDDVVYHEEPGAGHWWGNRCCDWPPMFEFFEGRRRPDLRAVNHVEFRTANPGVSATTRWLTIEQQIESCALSLVIADRDPAADRVTITTENVSRLTLDPAGFEPGPVSITIDGEPIDVPEWPADGAALAVARSDMGWAAPAAPLLPEEKGPHRAGPFKDAFRHRVQFVYGTLGTAEENAWARAKARFDAETFWYRGNAAVDVLPDHAFDAERDRDRGVVLYGNADTNGAWAPLLGESPVVVRRGRVEVEGWQAEGEDLGCLLVRPRPGSARASVAAVGGSGVSGMRLTDRLPYFVSGVGYPDVVVFGPEAMTRGAAGVRATGFFGPDWSVSRGQFAYAPTPAP